MNRPTTSETLDEAWYLDVSFDEYIQLVIEQMAIEKISFECEIQEMRSLLIANGIDHTAVIHHDVISDKIYERLLRYRLGYCGAMQENKKLMRAYKFRRKFLKMIERR